MAKLYVYDSYENRMLVYNNLKKIGEKLLQIPKFWLLTRTF